MEILAGVDTWQNSSKDDCSICIQEKFNKFILKSSEHFEMSEQFSLIYL